MPFTRCSVKKFISAFKIRNLDSLRGDLFDEKLAIDWRITD